MTDNSIAGIRKHWQIFQAFVQAAGKQEK